MIGGRPTVAGLFHTATTLCLLASLAGLLEFRGWPWELPAHFRVQCIGFLSACCFVHLLMRAWARLAVHIVGTSLLWFSLQLYKTPPEVSGAAHGSRLVVCSFNVLTSNRDVEPTLNFLRTNDFDAVFLMETDQRWVTALETLRPVYPFILAEPRGDNFGVAFLSRTKPAQAEILCLGRAKVPSIRARVAGMQIIGTHPRPPTSGESAALRNEQLDVLATNAAAALNTLIVGDLNCTPWTAPYKKFSWTAGKSDATSSFGRQPTWPVFAPAWLRIPIDHALVSPELRILDLRTGPDLGSDHLPLIVEVAARQP